MLDISISSNSAMEAVNHFKNSAAEADTTSKHGRSAVSHKNRGNIMQRIFLYVSIFGFSVASAFAQDVIFLKNGFEIQALIQEVQKVQEVGEEEEAEDVITFKMYDKLNSPEYTLRKWEIEKIKFANGGEEVFNVASTCPPEKPKRFAQLSLKYEKGKENCLRIFENRMNICGFAKRAVLFDAYSAEEKQLSERGYSVHWATIGVWLNYQEKLVAFRLQLDDFNEVIVPIENIRVQSFEIIEDGYVKSTGSAGFFNTVNFSSTAYVTEVKIRIVVGNVNTGTQAYFLVLHSGRRISKATPVYKSIVECTRLIFDELEFMANMPK